MSEYFKKHVEELWEKAINSIDFNGLKTEVSKLPDSKLRRYFRQAWDDIHLAKVMVQVSELTGEPPQQAPTEQLKNLGVAIAVVGEGHKRGFKYSQRAQNRLENEIAQMAAECGLTYRGKLVSINKTK